MLENKPVLTRFMSGTQWSSSWSPAADVYRVSQGWLVKCELAGVMEQDIQLYAKGHTLFVSGCRRDLLVMQGYQSYSMEIAYSRFERSIELPEDIEFSTMKPVFQDGMLLIYLIDFPWGKE